MDCNKVQRRGDISTYSMVLLICRYATVGASLDSGDAKGSTEATQRGKPGLLRRLLTWYLGFAIPGLGLFSEAYIIFCRWPGLVH